MYTLSEVVILYAGTQQGGECSPDTKLLGWIPLKYSILQNFNKILNSNLNLQTSPQKVSHYHYNPSRPNPGRREKIKLNFYFHTSLGCLKRFYEGLKGLHKTF